MSREFSQIGAIIVGAGSSHRMGVDKLFLPLAGKPLLAWSVDVFQDYELLDYIVLVLNEDNLDFGKKLVAERCWHKVSEICLGGERRQDSVAQGLMRLDKCGWVIVHDGARPFLTKILIEDGLKMARITGASAAAVPVKDTIKMSDEDGIVMDTLERQWLWAVQTPQIFRFDVIMNAHRQISQDVTDDATLVEKAGYRVKLYTGLYNNIKITTPDDLILAEAIAKGK